MNKSTEKFLNKKQNSDKNISRISLCWHHTWTVSWYKKNIIKDNTSMHEICIAFTIYFLNQVYQFLELYSSISRF
jgi:hypothetical protein